MNLYYKAQIEKIDSCPPENYSKLDTKCYRWVFDDINNAVNFKSQADKNPKVLNSKSDYEKCEYYALSFHDSINNSIRSYNELKKSIPNIRKLLGTKIAEGRLSKEDGLGSQPNKFGHFNFHHCRNHGFEKKFKIVQSI